MTTFFFKKIKTYKGDTGWGEARASASAPGEVSGNCA